MSEPHKILQIIHVSDLHINDGPSDKARLASAGRLSRVKLRDLAEKYNVSEWHEGTLGHDDTAERAFTRFLRGMKAAEPEWLGEYGSAARTWLLDTGDLTTFGDKESMVSGQQKLARWRELLGHCELRSLFGNHDAWPGVFPLFAAGFKYGQEMTAQQALIREWQGWQHGTWLEPLFLDVPDTDFRIELYALNSVCFNLIDNVLATGRLEPDALDSLAKRIKTHQTTNGRKCYRILATHHPIEFPFEPADASSGILGVSAMELKDAKTAADVLRNDLESDPRLSPYIHLFLSGHTHEAFPACPLPTTVKEMYQWRLGIRQMQLVAGPLLLVRDRNRVARDEGARVVTKERKEYPKPLVLDCNQQLQILRFYHAPDEGEGLWLERFILTRVPNDTVYRAVPELTTTGISVVV